MFLVRSSFPKLSKALYPNGTSLRSALLFEGYAASFGLRREAWEAAGSAWNRKEILISYLKIIS